MAYFYIDGEDGYKREFDSDKKFVPNENVAAFSPGPGFDWSVLGNKETKPSNQKTKSNANYVPPKVYTQAEEYAKENRKSRTATQQQQLYNKASASAKDAYAQHTKEQKLLSQKMTQEGRLQESQQRRNRAQEEYNQALSSVKNNLTDWTDKMQKTQETLEQKDKKDYVSNWKQSQKNS